MIGETAKKHFDDDVARARALLTQADAIPAGTLKDDVMRSAWMFAVGACDAYYCDAYVDALARTMRAKDAERSVTLPDAINKIDVPLGTVLHGNRNQAWQWRMFARGVMERENVLSLAKVKDLFSPFFRIGHKPLTADTIGRWILHRNSASRLFGVTGPDYRRSTRKPALREAAIKHLQIRIREHFQRRHDCIHSCDRPKIALQPISDRSVTKVIHDMDFLISRFHEDLQAEFPQWLTALGFSAVTRNQVTG